MKTPSKQRPQRSMALHMAALIMISAALVYGVALTFNYLDSRAMIEHNAHQRVRDAAHVAIREIEKELTSLEAVTRHTARTIEILHPSPPRLDALLSTTLQTLPTIFGICAAFEPHQFEPGQTHFAIYHHYDMEGPARTRLAMDYFNRDWYLIPKILEQAEWTEPYFSEVTQGVLMATYSEPLYKTNDHGKPQLAGILAADLTLDWLSVMTRTRSIRAQGEPILLSRNGTYLVHPDRSRILVETIFDHAEALQSEHLRNIGRRMRTGQEGLEELSADEALGEESWLYHAPIAGAGWTLAVIYPKPRIYADLDALTRKLLWIGLACFLTLFLLSTTSARCFTKPVTLMAATARHLAEGHLEHATADLPGLEQTATRLTTREYTQLAASFITMTRKITSLLTLVRQIAMQVATSATEISASARQLNTQGETHATAATQVAAAGESIHTTSNRLAERMTQLDHDTRQAADTAQTAEESLRRIARIHDHMLTTSEAFDQKMQDIQEKTDGIGLVIATITQVANQTNLLSLNAAMEAEKAGENGRGFAVVARQIRALADQTGVAALDIAALVEGARQSVRQGVHTVQEVREILPAGAREFESVSRTINGLLEQVRALDPEFEQANLDMQAQAESARQISEAMRQVQETAIHSRDALAEFLDATENLRDASVQLEDEIKNFGSSAC